MPKRAVFPEYMVPVNGQWMKFADASIDQMTPQRQNVIDEYIYAYQQNPLALSLMHGKKRNDGSNDGITMCNDRVNDLILMTAPNQSGKSYLGAVYTALRLIPTDPKWPCFTQHGLKHYPWEGPKIAIVGSYTWDLVNVLWQTYQKILPRNELGCYAPMYGIFPDERERARDITFSNYRSKQIRLKCGSQIVFLCYKQSLSQWESRQCDLAHCDEQIPEDYFDALSQRQVTRGAYTPIIMTLTGHIIPDRPDTGAAGWIKTKIVDKGITKGRKVAQYKIAIEDVPDAIMSKETKEQLHTQWVKEPNELNDEKKLREAEARYWGGWEVGGSLVLSEFNPDIHVVQPFDYRRYKPTYYRMIDHGQNPCAAAIFAMMPWGDTVMVKEYYEYGRDINANSQGILEMCGNGRRKVDEYNEMGQIWPIYEELMDGMQIYDSELDTRSFGKKSELMGNRNLGQLYNQFGCTCTQASGQHDKVTIPLLKQYLALEKGRQHLRKRIGGEYPENLERFGAPRMYFFSTCKNTISEILRWAGEDKDDHLISCCKFFSSRERSYQGDYGSDNVVQAETKLATNSMTGY